MTGSYRLEWVEDLERFDELRAAWDAIAAGRRLPFLRHDWFAAWWDAFGAGRALRTAVVWDGETAAAIFPLCAHGSRLQALANVHSPIYLPFARDQAALTALLDAVSADRAAELAVEALPRDDATAAALQNACARAGRLTVAELQHVSPIADTSGDRDAYYDSMNREARKKIERRRKKLEQEHGGRSSVDAPVDLEAELDRVLELEARGWKGRRGTAIVSSTDTDVFYRSVARRFHALGKLRIARVWADDREIAFDLCLVDHSRMWSLKGGYDEEFARFGPGMIVKLAQLDHCFSERLEALEILGDDAPWKRLFATGSRAHCHVRAYRRTPAGAGRFVYRRALRPRLKRAYRRLRPLPTPG